MKRILILGCNELTKRLLIELCKYQSYVSGICLASRKKEDCDELRELALSMGVRVTTAGIDMNNVEAAMMMVRIFAPDMVVNLLPPELSLSAMDLAIKAKADYIDSSLFGVPDFPSPISLLSKQFEKFSAFQNNCNTAVKNLLLRNSFKICKHFAAVLKVLNCIFGLIFNQNPFGCHPSIYKLIFKLRCLRVRKPFKSSAGYNANCIRIFGHVFSSFFDPGNN